MNNDYAGLHLKEYETRRYTASDYDRIQRITLPPEAVDFPDVSFYQGVIDWAKMAANTIGVMLRVSQNEWKDEQFERNYAEGKARGVHLAGYTFYDGRVSPEKQLATIKAAMQGKAFEMEYIVDWERNYGGTYEGLPNVVKLMKGIEAAGIGCKAVGMYTGYYWFRENTNASVHANEYAYLATRPLHLAWYASPDVVKVPAPWTNWTHWQYGTPPEGAKYGVQSVEIDKNKFNGNDAVFAQRYGGNPPPTGGSMYRIKVKSTATPYVNIRAGASTSSADIGDAYPNAEYDADYYELDASGNKFDHIPALNGYIMRQYTNVISGTEIPKPVVPPPTPTLPATWENTLVAKDAGGNVLATYKGTLTKQ